MYFIKLTTVYAKGKKGTAIALPSPKHTHACPHTENGELTVIPLKREKWQLPFVLTQVLAFTEPEQENPEEEQLSSMQSPMQSQMQTRMQMRMQILKSSRLPKYLVKVQKRENEGGIITEKSQWHYLSKSWFLIFYTECLTSFNSGNPFLICHSVHLWNMQAFSGSLQYLKPQADQDGIHAGFAQLLSEFNKPDALYSLSLANRLYGEQSYEFVEVCACACVCIG